MPGNELERLRRDVASLRADVKGLAARLSGSGFSPAPLAFTDTISSGSAGAFLNTIEANIDSYALPFPGSIVAMSVSADVAPSGTPGADYYTFEASVDNVVTGFGAVLDAGDATGVLVQSKGSDTFTTDQRIRVQVGSVTGTPGTVIVNVLLWVSFT